MTTGAPVLLHRDPPFARLVLNRPERLNALDAEMWRLIPGLVDACAQDIEIKLLLVSGVDAGAFAAGADISEFLALARSRDDAAAYAARMGEAMAALAGFPKPAIAVVQGACVGGGCGLALCCDFRFADPTARFGVTPARLGVAYPLEDTKRLVNAVGLAAARDLLMTGRIVEADEALRIGLIDRLAAPGSLWDEARAYGRAIAGRSQYSVRAAKKILGAVAAGTASETDWSRALFVDSFAGEDLAEGAAAFLEKRQPRFTFS